MLDLFCTLRCHVFESCALFDFNWSWWVNRHCIGKHRAPISACGNLLRTPHFTEQAVTNNLHCPLQLRNRQVMRMTGQEKCRHNFGCCSTISCTAMMITETVSSQYSRAWLAFERTVTSSVRSIAMLAQVGSSLFRAQLKLHGS